MPLIVRFLRAVALIDLAAFGVAGLMCWVIGPRTLAEFGAASTWIGIVILFFAGVTGLGSFSTRARDATMYSVTDPGHMRDHIKQMNADMLSGFGCLIVFLVAGILPIAVGSLLQHLVYAR